MVGHANAAPTARAVHARVEVIADMVFACVWLPDADAAGAGW